jgi:hypothetical protein
LIGVLLGKQTLPTQFPRTNEELLWLSAFGLVSEYTGLDSVRNVDAGG